VNSISRNFACGAKLCIFIVAAFCIVVVLPPAATGDTKTARIQATAKKDDVLRQIDLAAANSTGKGVAKDLKASMLIGSGPSASQLRRA